MLTTDPNINCPICPRLVDFRLEQRKKFPNWHNGPVDTWISQKGDEDVKLLIVGLAPGLRGANRTARPFTGDWAGDLLYGTLLKYHFATGTYKAEADDGLQLNHCAITNAVRCVPPQNKPVAEEINNCRPYLLNTIARFPNLKAIVTLGKVSHDSTARALGERISQVSFAHNKQHQMGNLTVFSSYHCSRYNTNTGKLTQKMFEQVFESVNDLCF